MPVEVNKRLTDPQNNHRSTVCALDLPAVLCSLIIMANATLGPSLLKNGQSGSGRNLRGAAVKPVRGGGQG